MEEKNIGVESQLPSSINIHDDTRSYFESLAVVSSSYVCGRQQNRRWLPRSAAAVGSPPASETHSGVHVASY